MTHTNGFTHIGRRQRRADAPERLTGRTRFANDLLPAGALVTRFVRSPYASAKITNVNSEAARQVPGVVAVLTARDLPIPDVAAAATAREILLAHASDVAAAARFDTLVELGSGTSEKTRVLLRALHATGRAHVGVAREHQQPLRADAGRVDHACDLG